MVNVSSSSVRYIVLKFVVSDQTLDLVTTTIAVKVAAFIPQRLWLVMIHVYSR